MEKLKFTSAEQLRQFYFDHGYYAVYDCSTEYGEVEIDHYSLLKSGEPVSPDCHATSITDLKDDAALNILNRFLKTGTVRIHPNIFTV